MSVDCVNQLGFHRPLTSLVKESLVVRNPNNRPVVFKIKTTAPKQYCVRPNSGRIEPGQEVEVQVLLQAMKEEPPTDFRCRDKFLVQSTIISAEHESSSISVLWSAVESKSRDDIHEKKIRCVFLPADGAGYTHSTAHDTHRESSPAPVYHGAETSTSDPRQFDSPAQNYSTADRSELFKVAPALANLGTTSTTSREQTQASTSTSTSTPSVESQLRDATAKIEKLQQELSTARSTTRRSDVKKSAHNEGVPVPMTALIALIAFMAAYLLF